MDSLTPPLAHDRSVASRLARLAHIQSDPLAMDVVTMRVAEGERLREIAEAWQVPHGKLLAWILGHDERRAQYEGALRVHAHHLVSECVGIADNPLLDADVGRDKLRIETRFRVAGYHAKETYGDVKGGGGTQVNVIVNRSGAAPTAPTVEAVPVTQEG